jgi:sortase A
MRTALQRWLWLVIVTPVRRSSRSYFDRCHVWPIQSESRALSQKLERFLLIFGLLMLSIYAIARIQGKVLSQAEVLRFMSSQSHAEEPGPSVGNVTVAPDFSLWSKQRIKDFQKSLAASFSPAVAVLRIPKIHLEVPVLQGTDDLTLNRAVGLIPGTALPGEDGNLGIAGHRDGFFRGLKDLRVGDPIELVTESKINTYIIDRIVIVDPSDVSVLARRPRTSVTLVTCYPFYFVGDAPQRYVVQASLITPSSSNVEQPVTRTTGGP